MKKLYTTIILALIYLSANAQAPNWAWAKGAGGTGNDYNASVATDASSNVYITGFYYSPSITFGTITLTNADITGNTADIFIVKYDAFGNILWVKGAGSTGQDLVYSITTDDSSNVYITGYYSSSITFGTIALSNAGSKDIFIVKYDASGNVLWAKGEGSTGNDYSESVTADASGNLYITGYYNSNSINFGVTTLSNSGGYDIFIVKYNASGTVLWAKGAGSTEFDEGLSTVTDASSNVYITGFYYSPSITFGTITLTNADITGNSPDIFIVKYDASGNLLWAKGAGSAGFEISNSTITDASGNVYITGFYSSPSITLGTITLTNADITGNSADIFIVKYDALGNVIWANGAGGTGYDRGYNINSDASGNVYVSGYYDSPSLTFGAAVVNNLGSNDIFIVKYDALGNLIWAKGEGSTGDDFSRGAFADAAGNVYLSGYYSTPFITFGAISLMNPNAGSTDVFIVKLNCGPTPILTSSSSTTFCIGDSVSLNSTPASSYLWSTNDTTQNITVSNSGSYYVNVTDSIGCTVSSTATTVTANALPAVDLGNDVSVCDGDNAVLTANATGGLSPYNYSWSNGLGNANTHVVTPLASSTYTVNVTDYNNCSSNTDSVTITLNPLPPTPTVGINGTQLTSSIAAAYQWLDCDNSFVAIVGETNQSFTATISGNYAVLITENGCSDTSACFNVFVVGLNANNNTSIIRIYPNPANDILSIQTTKPLLIEIYSLEGNLIESRKVNGNNSFGISNYANGMYLIKATDNNGGFSYHKLLKQ